MTVCADRTEDGRAPVVRLASYFAHARFVHYGRPNLALRGQICVISARVVA